MLQVLSGPRMRVSCVSSRSAAQALADVNRIEETFSVGMQFKGVRYIASLHVAFVQPLVMYIACTLSLSLFLGALRKPHLHTTCLGVQYT